MRVTLRTILQAQAVSVAPSRVAHIAKLIDIRLGPCISAAIAGKYRGRARLAGLATRRVLS
jgi:hypothetical protein